MDCWAKGGGKEGQGPRGKKGEKGGKLSGESANIAEDEDGVWMAAMDNSSNADNEGSWLDVLGRKTMKTFGLWTVNQTHLHLLCHPLTL